MMWPINATENNVLRKAQAYTIGLATNVNNRSNRPVFDAVHFFSTATTTVAIGLLFTQYIFFSSN